MISRTQLPVAMGRGLELDGRVVAVEVARRSAFAVELGKQKGRDRRRWMEWQPGRSEA